MTRPYMDIFTVVRDVLRQAPRAGPARTNASAYTRPEASKTRLERHSGTK